MPRTQSTRVKNPKKKKPIKKINASNDKSKSRSVTKTKKTRKKSKTILVDVIEDELEANDNELDVVDAETEEVSDRKEITPEPINKVDDSLDKQKEFFSNMLVEKEDFSNQEQTSKNERNLGLYRRLAVKFIVLVLILLGIVAYFSFTHLTIAINLKGETINSSMLLKVYSNNSTSTETIKQNNDPRSVVKGEIKDILTTVKKTYSSSGEKYLGDEIVGQVRIINHYSKSQTLVATTRLLSPAHKLFRLKKAVHIPAGGEVIADIYADKPSADMAIGPSHFTIPGLWLGLQDKIYAQSDRKFVYKQKVQKYVNFSDLDRATNDISNALLVAAKKQANTQLPVGDSWLYLNEESPTINIDAKNGSKKDSFTAQASGHIIAVYFSKDQASRLAKAKLNLLVPDDKELIDFKPNNIVYTLESYDQASKVATVKASFSGVMILKGDAEIVDKQKLVNLDLKQLNTYLKSQSEILSYDLKFFPSFIKKAPSLVDRIKIVVNK